MSSTLVGMVSWDLQTNPENGHRTYTIDHLITSTIADGPFVVLQTAGLPTTGSVWDFGDDYDPWAYCTPGVKINIHQPKEGDPNKWWKVQNTFTTIPQKRCATTSIENPLMEPDRVSGSFVKYTKEASHDRFGNLLRTSSWERLVGPQVEFDANRPTVHIEQNVSALELDVFTPLVDTVNDSTMWGLPARCIKLSNASWERKILGVCDYYYTRIFDFDINFEGFDRVVLDEGTKCLHGHWADGADAGTAPDDWILININGNPPNKNNPAHFSRYQDRNGNLSRVFLDGNGLPAGVGLDSGSSGNPADITIEYYPENNLMLLGLPTSF